MIATILTILFKVVSCHLIGDYVLQTDFLAREKGKNWYCMFVHCFLYCIPFAILFGIDGRLVFIFIIHLFADTLKARYKTIGLLEDQIYHYVAALITYM